MANAALDELATGLRTELGEPAASLHSLATRLEPAAAWLGLVDADQDTAWAACDEPAQAARYLRRHLPHVQSALIAAASPLWPRRDPHDADADAILAWLSPPAHRPHAATVAACARVLLLASDLWKTAPREHLRFLLDALDRAVEHGFASAYEAAEADDERWRAAVSDLLAVPSRVANALGPRGFGADCPPHLERAAYMQRQSRGFVELVHFLAHDGAAVARLAVALGRLVRQGYFVDPDGFWPTVLPSFAAQMLDGMASLWPAIVAELPAHDAHAVVGSLCGALSAWPALATAEEIGDDARTLSAVKMAARLLHALLGPLAPDTATLDTVRDLVVADRRIGALVLRALPIWAAASGSAAETTAELMNAIMPVWANADLVARGPERAHRNLTICLLACLAAMPPASDALDALSRSRAFLFGVQGHLSATRLGFRLRGMLVAECLSARTAPAATLRFGDEVWAGDEAERLDARRLRALATANVDWSAVPLLPLETVDASGVPPLPVASTSAPPRPASAPPRPAIKAAAEPPRRPLIEVVGSDDEDADLRPYAMPDEGPPPERDEADTGELLDLPNKERPKAPVYVAALTALLRQADDAEALEVGLAAAPELVRRKAGTRELRENAVDLAIVLVGLQDNFDLAHFDDLRLVTLTLLAHACPQPVAPCLVEQLFGSQYSIQQRYAILSALALAATPPDVAEAAMPPIVGLPAPPARKQLPQRLVQVIGEPSPKMKQLTNSSDKAAADATAATAAAEAALVPLVNRLWLYLGDTASVPRAHAAISPYAGGAGSAVMLDPLLLGKLLATLATLVERCHLASIFESFVAPESLDLALALRHAVEGEADATAAAFDLVLVVLQGAMKRDRLDAFARQHRDALGALRDWAAAVWDDAGLAADATSRLARSTGAVRYIADELLAPLVAQHLALTNRL